ncbi:MAG: hypothetical protein K2X53_06725, partial [Alphaproteobacteria bacterium]|nr:hypothetical protein [Alphaproteobacteria bacterium]
MNKMKFFLTAYTLLATLFSTPFGTSCLYGSNESISEEGKADDPLLFKGRKGSTIQKSKLQKFLAPEFEM